jgi:hypothetical protein
VVELISLGKYGHLATPYSRYGNHTQHTIQAELAHYSLTVPSHPVLVLPYPPPALPLPSLFLPLNTSSHNQLRNWKEYLAFEAAEATKATRRDPSRVEKLFERAVIACANYLSIWTLFADFCEGRGELGRALQVGRALQGAGLKGEGSTDGRLHSDETKDSGAPDGGGHGEGATLENLPRQLDKAARVHERCTLALRFKHEAFVEQARFLERVGRIDDARSVLQRLSLDDAPGAGVLEVIQWHHNFERRHRGGAKEGLVRAASVFERALARRSPAAGSLTGDARAYVWAEKAQFYAKVCADLPRARATFREALFEAVAEETYMDAPSLVLQLLHLDAERGAAGRTEVRAGIAEFVLGGVQDSTCFGAGFDLRFECVFDFWAQYEESYGESLGDVEVVSVKRAEWVEARRERVAKRAREEEEESAAQLAAQMAAQQAAYGVGEGAEGGGEQQAAKQARVGVQEAHVTTVEQPQQAAQSLHASPMEQQWVAATVPSHSSGPC